MVIKLGRWAKAGICTAIFLLVGFLFFSLSRPIVPANGKEDGISVPIVMYHFVVEDTSRSADYMITPAQLESDLQYLQRHGFHTVLMSDLINYVYNGTPLPEKPIVLTFDDGYYNNYLYAFPLLQKYQMKAVISIIGSQTDRYTDLGENYPAYSHCTWDQLVEMTESGLVEVQNHSYNLHSTSNGRKGCAKKEGESLEEYRKLLTNDVTKLQMEIKAHTGFTPNTFTYPFGSYTKETEQIIRDLGFQATLSCSSGISKVTSSPDSLYLMKRFLRTHRVGIDDYLAPLVS